jgi:hypothetical protein
MEGCDLAIMRSSNGMLKRAVVKKGEVGSVRLLIPSPHLGESRKA